MIEKIKLFMDVLKRDKPGAIILVLFIMILQTNIYWQQMLCIGIMILVFLIRNLGKLKKENDMIDTDISKGEEKLNDGQS